MSIHININDSVRVRLTWEGIKRAVEQGQKDWVERQYRDGFVMVQLHALMNCFGPVLYCGSEQVFKENDIEILPKNEEAA